MHNLRKILRVYDDTQSDVFIEVRTNSNCPEYGIEVVTTTPKSIEWYGEILLLLNSKKEAQLLAQAILEMAETIE